MDYRSRHTKITSWRKDSLNTVRRIQPFDHPGISWITELDAMDGTTFLAMCSEGLNEVNNELMTSYLIEAPRTCPMRLAFECGEITYEDYWDHKGWLIQLQDILLAPDDSEACYIHPSQMDYKTRKRLKEHENISPYQVLFNQLHVAIMIDKRIGDDYTHWTKQLERLLQEHGSKIAA